MLQSIFLLTDEQDHRIIYNIITFDEPQDIFEIQFKINDYKSKNPKWSIADIISYLQQNYKLTYIDYFNNLFV